VPESPPYRRETLPPLEGSERDAFPNGEYQITEQQAGKLFYRSEGGDAPMPGGWLGEEPALTKGGHLLELLEPTNEWKLP